MLYPETPFEALLLRRLAAHAAALHAQMAQAPGIADYAKRWYETEYARYQAAVVQFSGERLTPSYFIAASQAGGVLFQSLVDEYGKDAARAIFDYEPTDDVFHEASDVVMNDDDMGYEDNLD